MKYKFDGVKRWLVLVGTALFVIGCAMPISGPVAPASAPPQPVPEREDGQLEEVVVTGAVTNENERRRVERQRRTRVGVMQLSRMASESDQFGADDVLAYAGDEEIWVISKPAPTDSSTASDDPGTGSMVATYEQQEIPLPLEHTDVTAKIVGYISTVNVRQKFSNPYDSKIEAVYVFPLPEKAAVSEFLMIIGDRKIRGILREKEEAAAIYAQARAQGYQASLLEQHRPNIFEQKVANIEPGKSIDVDIRYFHTLTYNDGWYSFVFPTVVGPRYNPPHASDPIVPVPRGETTSFISVPYLRPEERSGHDISISVEIDAGVKIEEVRSTHEIVAKRPEPDEATVQLARESTIPNRDFILDFRIAGETMKSNMLTWVDPESQQGFFTMMLYPPKATEMLERQNMEMVFVIDASGSMSGTPISQARDAVRAALDQLWQGDTFQIIRFSDNASSFGPDPVPATPENIRRARRYLDNLNGGGGTQMIEGIRAALDFPHDKRRMRFVSFLTDGYIGNEVDILREIHQRLGDTRIFSFGVGTSVNRYLMERMAKVGKGAVAYLGPQDSGYEIMGSFFRRISHPAMTDVEIDWGGMAVSDVYPRQLPDLFVGRPVVVTGTFAGSANSVSVNGRAADRERRLTIESDGEASGGPYLAKIWARQRIAELKDRQSRLGDPGNELASSIRETALRYQLMSDYTSFVAVDSSQRTEGTEGTTVHQAVPVPAGVRYETTVGQ